MQKQDTLQNGENPEEQAQPALSGADAPVRIGGAEPPNARGGGNAPGWESTDSGAPPSNTAPANCILTYEEQNELDFIPLRYGIDSLYLSYPGMLASSWEQRLEGLKRAAQSTEISERSNAQVRVGEHLFEIKDKGKGRFAYVLVDNCFHIQLSSGQSTVLPLAYVQLSSELLTAL